MHEGRQMRRDAARRVMEICRVWRFAKAEVATLAEF